MSAEAAQNQSEDLVCGSCSHVNPGENNFCGNCGAPLRQAVEGVADRAEPSPEQVPSFAEIFGLESPSQRRSREQSAISGPSFLGLDSDAAVAAPDFGYNESGSHAGRWVALFVILGLIAFGVAKWKSLQGVVLPRVAQLKSYANTPQPPQPQVPPPSAAATEQNPVSSTATETASPEAARPTEASSAEDAKGGEVSKTEEGSSSGTSKAQPAEEENSAEDTAQPPEESPKREATAKKRRQDEVQEASPKKARRATGQVRRNRQIEMAKTDQAPDNSLVLTGEKYLYGRGTPRSCQQALVYFRTAAQAQNSRAMSHLGTMYATGTCVRQDRVQAYRWLSQALAEESNNHFLEQNLTMLWRDMTPAEKQVVLTKSR